MSTRHRHKYQRLSDEALFCECGEVKYVVAPVCTRPHWYGTYYPVYPYVPTPTAPFIWGTSTTVANPTIGSVTYALPDDNVTYTDGTS